MKISKSFVSKGVSGAKMNCSPNLAMMKKNRQLCVRTWQRMDEQVVLPFVYNEKEGLRRVSKGPRLSQSREK